MNASGPHLGRQRCDRSVLPRIHYDTGFLWPELIMALDDDDDDYHAEPHVLPRLDGKRLDGLTLTSWRESRSATWDVTITTITVDESYLSIKSTAETAAQR
jgi:hypothetical protein